MAIEFPRTVPIILSLFLTWTGAALSQNGSGMSAISGGSSSSGSGSGGFGSVDSSVAGSLPLVGTGSVVSASVNGSASGARAGGSSSGRSGLQTLGNTTSSSGVNGNASLASAPASKQAAASRLHSSASRHSALGSANELTSLAAKSSHGSTSIRSSVTGQSSLGGTSKSSAGGGQYINDFPDSTKNMAVISPPASNTPLFAFEPGLTERFPDLNDYHFLRPSFHVAGGPTSSTQQKEDLYRRIQQRLTAYKEAETPKNGFKAKGRRWSGGSGKPSGRKTLSAEDKLNKP